MVRQPMRRLAAFLFIALLAGCGRLIPEGRVPPPVSPPPPVVPPPAPISSAVLLGVSAGPAVTSLGLGSDDAAGALASFSFYPTKNLGAYGDGGAILTSDAAIAERLRKLRVFQPHEYYSLDYAEQQVAVCQLIPSDDPATLPNLIAGGLEVTRREPLAVELESFLTAVRTHTTPVVTGADGRWALRMALEVLEKIRAHAIRAEIGLHFE